MGCGSDTISASLATVDIAPADLELTSLKGKGYKLRDWLTSYPFLLTAIDPYTAESSWILETSSRIFAHFSPADVRVAWVVTSDTEGAKEFLGPLAEEFLTFSDPDRKIVNSLGLEYLPGLLHIRSDGFTQTAQGWNPSEWKAIADRLTKILAWSKTTIPTRSDPSPFPGTPVNS